MVNYWSQVCLAQANLPLSQLLQANYGSSIFAVVSFGFAAVLSGVFFVLWVRLQVLMKRRASSSEPSLTPSSSELPSTNRVALISPRRFDKIHRKILEHMWGQLGWFTALMCLGSVAGAVAWFAMMQSNDFAYKADAPGIAAEQQYPQLASSDRWFAVFHIHYPVEFLCLIIPKLMMLHRLISRNASQAEDLDGHVNACDCIRVNALEKLYRAISAIVVVCGVVGVAAMCASASFRIQLAGVYDEAAGACGTQQNNTDSCNALRQVAITVGNKAGTSGSIQNVLEAVALVVVSLAYAVLIPVSVAMFGRVKSRLPREMPPRGVGVASAALDRTEKLHAAATAKRRRIVAACCVVLVTFIIRASFDLLQAYAAFNDPYNPECGICDPCQTDAYLIRRWLSYTPHFQSIVVSLSSPLPLMISLWLMMTTEERLQLLFPGTHDMTYSNPEQQIYIEDKLEHLP